MTQQTNFQQTIVSFLRELEGGNKSQLTLTAYKTDLMQFFQWLSENDVMVTIPGQVTRGHVKDVFREPRYSCRDITSSSVLRRRISYKLLLE